MNRIEKRFKELRANGQKGFVAYIGAGDPNLSATESLAVALDKAGVDVLELGVPFSDPLADGLVNQLSAQRGLASGTTPQDVLETVWAIRQKSEMPIVLYIYFNLMHHRGLQHFIEAAAEAGVDGLLALDLPPEEADEYESMMKAAGLCSIWLVAPTTPAERISAITARGSGFIYYISREGVTGMQQTLSDSIAERTRLIRDTTDLPIAVGFGISNPKQARQVAASSDAIVVGSAIVSRVAELGDAAEMPVQVADYVRGLVDAIRD